MKNFIGLLISILALTACGDSFSRNELSLVEPDIVSEEARFSFTEHSSFLHENSYLDFGNITEKNTSLTTKAICTNGIGIETEIKYKKTFKIKLKRKLSLISILPEGLLVPSFLGNKAFCNFFFEATNKNDDSHTFSLIDKEIKFSLETQRQLKVKAKDTGSLLMAPDQSLQIINPNNTSSYRFSCGNQLSPRIKQGFNELTLGNLYTVADNKDFHQCIVLAYSGNELTSRSNSFFIHQSISKLNKNFHTKSGFHTKLFTNYYRKHRKHLIADITIEETLLTNTTNADQHYLVPKNTDIKFDILTGPEKNVIHTEKTAALGIELNNTATMKPFNELYNIITLVPESAVNLKYIWKTGVSPTYIKGRPSTFFYKGYRKDCGAIKQRGKCEWSFLIAPQEEIYIYRMSSANKKTMIPISKLTILTDCFRIADTKYKVETAYGRKACNSETSPWLSNDFEDIYKGWNEIFN